MGTIVMQIRRWGGIPPEHFQIGPAQNRPVNKRTGGRPHLAPSVNPVI
jgi:hypothetical protein